MRLVPFTCLLGLGLLPGSAAPQQTARLSEEGVYRAAALVDAVFVERTRRESTVAGGDFASFLVARLGVRPVPPGLALDVLVDSSAVQISGRLDSLPPAVKASLGSAVMLVDPASVLTADVVLAPARAGVIRFHLRSILVNGFPLPEPLLAPLMAQVGSRHPALTSTGRDLLVAIPADGQVELRAGTVRVAISGPLAESVGSR
jgi:hypothetical protein